MAAARKSVEGMVICPDRIQAEEAVNRGNVYGLLALIFRAPLSAPVLREVRTPVFQKALLRAGVRLGEDFSTAAEESLRDELTIDYTQLFHGPRNHLPPFESINVGGAGATLNGKAASSVRQFLEASGFFFNEDSDLLPDHLSVELEFMAELTRREGEYWRTGDADSARRSQTRQRLFLDRHLAAWGREFGRKIEQRATSPFYREAGRLLSEFLETEREDLDGRPEDGLFPVGPQPHLSDDSRRIT